LSGFWGENGDERTPSSRLVVLFYFLREKKDKRFGTIYAPLNGQIALS
jgi:hypothetical protein